MLIKKKDTLAYALGIKCKHWNPIKKKYRRYFNNTCFIRSLAKVSGESPKKVYKKLLKYTKKFDVPNSSLTIERVALKCYGMKPDYSDGDITVGAYCAKHYKGTYLITTDSHTFAYIDGVIYDSNYIGKKPTNEELDWLLMQYIHAVQYKK